jgi:hypothetical protein
LPFSHAPAARRLFCAYSRPAAGGRSRRAQNGKPAAPSAAEGVDGRFNERQRQRQALAVRFALAAESASDLSINVSAHASHTLSIALLL